MLFNAVDYSLKSRKLFYSLISTIILFRRLLITLGECDLFGYNRIRIKIDDANASDADAIACFALVKSISWDAYA